MIYVYYKSYFKGGKIMNKKKLGTGLVALALVGVVGIGGSLAWFTDTESETNTFSTKHIDITLTEPRYDELQNNGKEYMPGDTFEKDPTITLSGDSAPAYVRIKDVDVKITKQDGTTETRDLENFLPKFDNENWVASGDGNYYYQKVLNAGESTTALFSEITIPSNLNNDYVNADFEIVIDAEAVQADNFESSLVTDGDGNINGWLIGNDQIQEYVDLTTNEGN